MISCRIGKVIVLSRRKDLSKGLGVARSANTTEHGHNLPSLRHCPHNIDLLEGAIDSSSFGWSDWPVTPDLLMLATSALEVWFREVDPLTHKKRRNLGYWCCGGLYNNSFGLALIIPTMGQGVCHPFWQSHRWDFPWLVCSADTIARRWHFKLCVGAKLCLFCKVIWVFLDWENFYGFHTITALEIDLRGILSMSNTILERVRGTRVYISVDIE